MSEVSRTRIMARKTMDRRSAEREVFIPQKGFLYV
jgi:hypothetical protein